MSDVHALTICLHGLKVGTLACLPGDRTTFAFAEDYIGNPLRPMLGLGFKDTFGELITEFGSKQTRLMPFFSGLLPEGSMRTYLAELAGVHPEREFFLLRALGHDLPGAVTAKEGFPAYGRADPSDDNESIRGRSKGGSALRFSLAGAQLKFSALQSRKGGLAIPARGMGGDWIVKLPSLQHACVPENEFSMMTIARLCGIDVPATALIDVSSITNLPKEFVTLPGQALAVKRFDRREGGGAVHMEDFAQVFGVYPEEKYAAASCRNIADVLATEAGSIDIAEFVRRVVFNMLIGNADMHLKNWSVIYPDTRKARLSPAYDLVATVAFIPDENAALKISRIKRFDQFTVAELLHLAAKARLPGELVRRTARETVALFHESWQAHRTNLPLPKRHAEAIDRHLNKVPIARASP